MPRARPPSAGRALSCACRRCDDCSASARIPPCLPARASELMTSSSIHASAVLVGTRAVLIRGPSGSGKSRLALELIQAKSAAPFARLVADDRAYLEAAHG